MLKNILQADKADAEQRKSYAMVISNLVVARKGSAEIQFWAGNRKRKSHPQLASVDCRKETNCQLSIASSGHTVYVVACEL